MTEPGRSEMLFGTSEAVAATRVLRAGPLQVELADGGLRCLSWHGIEAVRAIAYLVRDENWGSHAPGFDSVDIEEGEGYFRAAISGRFMAANGAALRFDSRIEGSADGRLVFDVTATPDADFITNRCGFCILHPIVGVAGSAVEIEHSDGGVERSVFPDMIQPAQPFFEIRAIRNEISPGVTAVCRMEGDSFEMEDQRNWSDASYKTYVRPLALPWPYLLLARKPLRQTVAVTLSGSPGTSRHVGRGQSVGLEIGERYGEIADFGLAVRPEETAATIASIARLADIRPRCLVLSFDPSKGHGLDALAGYADLLRLYPAMATLECVLPCKERPEEELDQIARLVDATTLPLSAISVSPAPDLKSTPPGSKWPDCPPFEAIYTAARAAFPTLPLGGGMFSYFTELNRKRPPADMLDFISHTTSPLVHAADDRSVMETLEALPHIARSVRALFGDIPYRIGPSAIGMRHNPYGARLAENPGGLRRMTMSEEDPRQKGLFAAAWMIGYAAATADAGLDVLTLGGLTGPFGVVENDRLRPAFHAAKALATLSGKPATRVISSDPARVLALAGGDTVLIANLTGDSVNVEMSGIGSVAILDEGSFALASVEPNLARRRASGTVSLGAYAIAIATLASAAS